VPVRELSSWRNRSAAWRRKSGSHVAVVVDGDKRRRRLGAGTRGERDGAGAVSHGVVDDVAEGALEQGLVGVDHEVVGHADVDGAAGLLVELAARPPRGGAERGCGRDVFRVRGGAAERPECQERVGERDHGGRVGREPAQCGFVLLGRPRLAQCEVDLGRERGERRA
jgi:hypothetical protein